MDFFKVIICIHAFVCTAAFPSAAAGKADKAEKKVAAAQVAAGAEAVPATSPRIKEFEKQDPAGAMMYYVMMSDAHSLGELLDPIRQQNPKKFDELVRSRDSDRGFNALHMLCSEPEGQRLNPANDALIVQVFVKNGLSVNSTDVYGRTPLHYAAYTLRDDIIPLLIHLGAKYDVQDKEGKTPLYLLAEREVESEDAGKKMRIAHYLASLGADVPGVASDVSRAMVLAHKRTERKAYNFLGELLAQEKKIAEELLAQEKREAEQRARQRDKKPVAQRRDQDNKKIIVDGTPFLIPPDQVDIFGVLGVRNDVDMGKQISPEAMRAFYALLTPTDIAREGLLKAFKIAANHYRKDLLEREILTRLRRAMPDGSQQAFKQAAQKLQSEILEKFVTQIINERRGRERDRDRK